MRNSRPFPRVPMLPVAVLAVLAAAFPALAQDRSTLETRISGDGSFIAVEWSKKHPWNAALMRGGAFLFAEYRDGAGRVGMDCLQGAGPRRSPGCGVASEQTRAGNPRSFRFKLPEAISSTPAGPVCLAIGFPGQRVLPVRRASKENSDTARFRYPAWESQVSENAATAAIRRRIAETGLALEQATANLRNLEANNATAGWTSAESCRQITLDGFDPEESDRPIARPEEQDTIARRVCIMRVWEADHLIDARAAAELKSGKLVGSPVAANRILSLEIGAVPSPPAIGAILTLLPKPAWDAPFLARVEQAGQFETDWRKFAPEVPKYKRDYPKPHFESFSPVLLLQTETSSAGTRVAARLRRGGDAGLAEDSNIHKDIRGFVGGALEAYARCVADGRGQLAASYRNAMLRKAGAESMKARVREELVAKCEAAIARVTAARSALRQLQEQLGLEKRALQSRSGPQPLSARLQVLNFIPCQP